MGLNGIEALLDCLLHWCATNDVLNERQETGKMRVMSEEEVMQKRLEIDMNSP